MAEPCTTLSENEHLSVASIFTGFHHVPFYQPERKYKIAHHGDQLWTKCDDAYSTQSDPDHPDQLGQCIDGLAYNLPICLKHCEVIKLADNLKVSFTPTRWTTYTAAMVPRKSQHESPKVRHETKFHIECQESWTHTYTGSPYLECRNGDWLGHLGYCEPITAALPGKMDERYR